MYPFLIHYRFRHWPTPLGYHPDKPVVSARTRSSQIAWTRFPSRGRRNPPQIRGAPPAHKTQYEYSGKYLASFVRSNELFGDYPLFRLKGTEKIPLEKGDHKETIDLPEELRAEEKEAFVDWTIGWSLSSDGKLVLSTYYLKEFKNKFRFDLVSVWVSVRPRLRRYAEDPDQRSKKESRLFRRPNAIAGLGSGSPTRTEPTHGKGAARFAGRSAANLNGHSNVVGRSAVGRDVLAVALLKVTTSIAGCRRCDKWRPQDRPTPEALRPA